MFVNEITKKMNRAEEAERRITVAKFFFYFYIRQVAMTGMTTDIVLYKMKI